MALETSIDQFIDLSTSLFGRLAKCQHFLAFDCLLIPNVILTF